MAIIEYDGVDPIQVLHLTMLALDFPLTPERAADIRRTDPRPFPFLTVNAVEDGVVLGQVGVFRLPMVSLDGREDVGGVWAVSTQPQHAGRGIATRLLDEAHERLRREGLRFSTLGTSRSGVAYRLYQRLGYSDMNVWATALARWEVAHQPSRLIARRPDASGHAFIEALFNDLALSYLGFARRHTPFAPLRDKVNPADLWVIWDNAAPCGYLFARQEGTLLRITVELLGEGVDAAEAVAAVASSLKSAYVQVTLSRPADVASLRRAGWQVAYPNWTAFMVKPLAPDVSADDARRLFGIGTDRFLISWLDVT